MGKLSKVIIFSVIISLTIFAFIGSAEAKLPENDIKTDDGYALCRYQKTVQVNATDSRVGKYDTNVSVYLWAYLQNKKYKTGAYIVQSVSENSKTEPSIPNYDSDLRDKEDMAKLLGANTKGSKWKCPDKIYLSGESGTDTRTNGKFIIHFANGKFRNGGGHGDTNNSIKEQLNKNLAIDLKKDSSKSEKNITVNLSKGTTVQTAKEAHESTVNDINNGDIGGEEETKNLVDTSAIKNWANGKKNGQFKKDNTNSSCGDVINQDVKDFLNQLFSYITIAGIILIVVMSMVSGIKVITLSEEKAIRSFFKSIWVRVVCLIILLLLPFLVNFVVSTVNNIAKIPGVNSNDPTCGVGK